MKIEQNLSFFTAGLELDYVEEPLRATMQVVLLKGPVVDLLRYVTGLVIFVSTSAVLAICVHMVLLRHTKRKNAAPVSPEQ